MFANLKIGCKWQETVISRKTVACGSVKNSHFGMSERAFVKNKPISLIQLVIG
jgi:hypothetical protein